MTKNNATFTEKVVELLSTQKASEDKCRQRRARRRRREHGKEKRTQFLEALTHPKDVAFIKNAFSKDSDNQTVTTCTTEEDDFTSVDTTAKEYQTAKVNVEDYSQPFVGKIQEGAAKVLVPDHREWYELY